VARLRTDLLDKRPLATLLETSKGLIWQTLVSGQPLSVRLCPSEVLPDEVQQWLADDLGEYDPALGTLAPPYHTGVCVGSEFRVPYHTDGHGFRNAQPWPDTAEIVVVGDAVGFGYGVEDDHTWPALLERAVAPTRVINLGLLEAGPQQYARVYATFGTTLHPTLVLVGLTMADDFRDAELFARWEREDSGTSYRAWQEGQDLLGSLPHSLQTLPALVAQYSSLYQVLRASHRLAQTSSQVVWLLGGKYLQVRPQRLAALLTEARPGRRGFHLVLEALAYLQVVARAHGTQVLVVILPSKEMTYLFPHDEAAHDPSRALRQALEQRGIAAIDLTPVFRQWASTGEPLFFIANRYPNAQGHALIAQEVAHQLTAAAQTYDLTP
jgi:acetyltransferase AlgX (SGNH hydrolase-like protein)